MKFREHKTFAKISEFKVYKTCMYELLSWSDLHRIMLNLVSLILDLFIFWNTLNSDDLASEQDQYCLTKLIVNAWLEMNEMLLFNRM